MSLLGLLVDEQSRDLRPQLQRPWEKLKLAILNKAFDISIPIDFVSARLCNGAKGIAEKGERETEEGLHVLHE